MFLDTSAIIRYQADHEDVKDHVDGADQLLTSTVCISEYLNGRVQAGCHDMMAERRRLPGVRSIEFSDRLALESGRLQDQFMDHGSPMANRDLMILTTAKEFDDEIVVVDTDFDNNAVDQVIDVTRFTT